MRSDKKSPLKSDKKTPPKIQKKGVVGYNKKSALLEDAITQMNAGKYGRASSALKELLALDPHNAEARRLFATLHLRLGSLMSARTAFESLAREALERQDYWLAESLLREYLVAGPRCVPFLDMLGHVYEEKGDAMAAVAEYGKAVEVLLEDPDPDNPNRASDLFAKIRELAPASPVAFRFAAMFDATTGLLIQQAVPPAADSITPSAEPAVSGDLPADLPSEPGSAPEVHSANLEVTPAEQPPSVAIEQSLEVAEPVLPDTAAPVETATAEGKKPQTEPPALADSISIPEGHLQTVFADSSESASAPSLSAALESTSEAIRSVEPVAPAQPVMPVEAGMPAEAVAPVESAMPIEAAAQPASVQLSESIADQTIEAPAEPIPSPIVPEVLSQPSSEPIAAAPSSPAPMPWDQVQEVAAELPAASAPEMKEEAPVEPPRPSLELISQPSPFRPRSRLLVLRDLKRCRIFRRRRFWCRRRPMRPRIGLNRLLPPRPRPRSWQAIKRFPRSHRVRPFRGMKFSRPLSNSERKLPRSSPPRPFRPRSRLLVLRDLKRCRIFRRQLRWSPSAPITRLTCRLLLSRKSSSTQRHYPLRCPGNRLSMTP
ncbi:MAG: tetratricopeptide repeat protein [Nitrospiraceae bacterium]